MSVDNTPNNQNNPYHINRPNLVGQSDRFQFESVSDIFDIANPRMLDMQLSDEYITNINAAAPVINSIYPTQRSNYNNPAPNYPSGNYDFIETSYPASASQGSKYELGTNLIDNAFARTQNEPLPQTSTSYFPHGEKVYFSREASAFDRYYAHPKFDELGFHPYRDNETYYNANSSLGDDYRRMLPQLANQISTGFKSAYRSMADFVEPGNPVLNADLESAREMERNMLIGTSTRGGVGGFANNLALNMGYTGGIFLSIAVEEAALYALQRATFNATAPLTAARTAKNAGRLLRAGKQVISGVRNAFTMGRAFTATRNLYRTFNNADKAFDFYTTVQTGGKFLGDFFAPETMKAIRSFKTTQNGLGSATNLAKLSKTAGGFYRDVRNLNYTLSESKLEGGFAYNEQLDIAMKQISLKENNGGPLTPEQTERANKIAIEASQSRILLNLPVIYLTNKIVLDKAFGSRFMRFGREAFEEGLGKMQKKLLWKDS